MGTSKQKLVARQLFCWLLELLAAVEALLHGRADPNHADPFLGETPLLRAVLSKSTNEMLWMLLEAKADPTKEDLGWRTPAQLAAAWGNSEAADILKAAAAGELRLGAMD